LISQQDTRHSTQYVHPQFVRIRLPLPPPLQTNMEDEPVELFESSRERQKYDDQASLYAIIVATEHLERAFARDAVSDAEYTTQCNKLISQFRLSEKAVCGKDMTTE